MLIDTHCHLDFSDYDADRQEVIQRAIDAGVTRIINIGSSLAGSRRSVELARQYDCAYATVGIHPHEADDPGENALAEIRRLAREKKVVAIGEIGLDYFKNFSQAANQKPLFSSLSALAKEMNLPLVIHCRQAQDDVLAVLKPLLPHKVVVHCFSGDAQFLARCLELGIYISYTFNITYKKAHDLRALVQETPLERMFLETDAPYLPPEGMRGKRNEPALVKNLAEEIARLKGVPPQEIAAATTANAKGFFNIP